MGLFWDSLKQIFKKQKTVELSQIAPETYEKTEQYERDERADHSGEQLDAIRYAYETGAFKQSSGKDVELLKGVTVGDPSQYWGDEWIEHPGLRFVPLAKIKKQYNNRLAIRKKKNQQKNWDKWKGRK